MMKRILTLALVPLLIISFMIGCSTPQPTSAPVQTTVAPTTPAAKPVEIRGVGFLPKNDTRTQSFAELLNIIGKKSNGTITAKFLGGSEVIPMLQLADNIKQGNVDIGMVPGGFFEGSVPGVSMIGLSQISNDEEIKRGLWGKLTEMCSPAGFYPVGRYMPMNDPLIYVGFKKGKVPATLKDLTGLKAGYSGPITKTWAEKLGMTFVQVPNAEFYTALDRGVVDALTIPLLDHVTYSMFDVESCIVDHPFSVASGYLLMSLKFWNGLSKDQQKAVTDAYTEWVPQDTKIQRAEVEKARKTLTDKKGATFFVKFTQAEADKYVQSFYDGEWEKYAKTMPDLAKTLRPLMSK